MSPIVLFNKLYDVLCPVLDAANRPTLADYLPGKGGMTAPAMVAYGAAHGMPPNPTLRYRAHIPTTWVDPGLREGRNRQV